MVQRDRKLSYPRSFSIMVSLRTGNCVDVLRVLDSSTTYRASVADATRRLILKGMLLEAAELAACYRTGKPTELTSSLRGEISAHIGVPASTDHAETLWTVLSRMWPELTEAISSIEDTQSAAGKREIASLLGASPLTAHGRALTAEEVRLQALRELAEGKIEAPKLAPPRTVQEAKAQARLLSAADRVAMDRGVPAEALLAQTEGGRLAELPGAPDESAGAQGWTSEDGRTGIGEKPGASSPAAQQASREAIRAKAEGRVRRQVPTTDTPVRRVRGR